MSRTYRDEFPDFDDTIEVLPGMVDTSWHNETMPQLCNEVAGIRLWIDYKDPAKSEFPDSRTQDGDAKRYSLYKVHDPQDIGKDELLTESDDLDEIKKAYAIAWIRWASVDGIGLGFHPDTSAEQYEPALDERLAEQYGDMIDFGHEQLRVPGEDVYSIGLQAWADAGMIPKP